MVKSLGSDIKVLKVEPFFMDEKCRTPIKFGSAILEELTFCMVRAWVVNKKGEEAAGWGGIFLADTWCYPTHRISHEIKDKVMRELVTIYCKLYENYDYFDHPVEVFFNLEKEFDRIKKEVCRKAGVVEEMPYLGALVCASPVDAALHDAFGNVNKTDAYDGYGREFSKYDLGRYLGDKFKNKYIEDYILKEYKQKLLVFHLVGGLDKLRKSEIDQTDPKDGLPVSLDEWIERDGLMCIKIKLRGRDIEWDINRIREVAAVAHEVKGDSETLSFSLDTNEQCESPEYIVEMLCKLREYSQRIYDEILYIEQPTERDLDAKRFNMKGISKLKPVIVDESLTGLNEFYLAMELGWSGIALKTCKCQSKALLFACLAQEMGIPYTVQDLTNPGIALVQSVGLAARLNTLMGVESNSVQFFPHTSKPEAEVHKGIFARRNGMVDTLSIGGYGLGYKIEMIKRELSKKPIPL